MEEVKCYMPQTLAEALQIRKETGAQPLAGGSDLMVANSRGWTTAPWRLALCLPPGKFTPHL